MSKTRSAKRDLGRSFQKQKAEEQLEEVIISSIEILKQCGPKPLTQEDIKKLIEDEYKERTKTKVNKNDKRN